MNFWLVLVVKDISTIYYILCFMKKLFLLFTLLIISVTVQAQVFTIDNNGIVKCPTATPGQKGTIFGEEYEAVDRALLEQRRDQGADLSYVCTSLVTDMSNLFTDKSFNQPIGNWDVSNVTNMTWMFRQSSFNQDISNWDVSKVTNMHQMFIWSEFNQPLEFWDVSNVTDMSLMFWGTRFNHPIGDWNVSNVTNMAEMFRENSTFSQDLSSWDVSSVTNMSRMFYGAQVFNSELSNWDVSKVIVIYSMFEGSAFNQPIGNWNVSNVSNMNRMFLGSRFNHPIGNWDVSNVTDMAEMFSNTPFNQDISNWNVSNVTNMRGMFEGSPFNQPIGNWDVSKVSNMNRMFLVTPFNHSLTQWCVSNITQEPSEFSAAGALSDENKPIWGSCPGRPARVTLASPSNNQTGVSLTPTLTWNEADGALEYELEFLLGSTVLQTEVLTSTSYTFTTPLNGNTFYRWRVRGKNDSGNPLGEWSTIWRFLTETVPVEQVVLVSPENGTEGVEPEPNFVWRRDLNATSYTIEISNDGFASTFVSESTTDTLFTAPTLNLDSGYSWRVKAFNSLGGGQWSETWSFKTIVSLLEQVTLGKPDNQDVVSPYQLLFTWNRDSNASSYDIEISTDDFESFEIQETVSDTSFATSELAFTTAYQWRVRASNGAGNGEWSSVRTFTTGQPIPGLIYPGNGLTGLYPALTFEWTSLESATSYGFELRNAATEEVIYSVESIAATQLSTIETTVETGGESVSLASLLEYDASYQWRARLYDVDNPGEWSEYATFSMIDSQTATLAFNMGITVTSGEISIPLRIGARSDATSGFDVNIDQTAPPEAPEGIDARLLRDGEFYFEDFVNLTTTVSEWRMQLKRISGDDPISLLWNPEELPLVGTFVLTSEDRSTIRINMREQSSLEVNVPQQIELFIQHIVAGTGSITTTLTMNSGWNLIGLPGSIPHEGFTNIFTESIPGTLYEFTTGYQSRTQLQPGIGYWIRYPQTVSETLSGEFVSEVTWNLKKGWNLVSGPSSSVSVSSIVDPQNVLIPNTFFDFRSQYGNSTLLNPGRGYWVRTSDAGTVVVSSDVSAKSVGTTLFSESTPVNANVIHVMLQTDTTTLYWGGQLPAGLTAESFSLPPVPPAGVVDVRFDQDSRWVSDETAVIYVRQNQDPISIAVSPSELALNPNDTYQLIEYEEVVLIGKSDLESGQVFTLSPRTTRVALSTLEVRSELPAEFTLDQNYPNPFNPTTTIRFGLPEPADVSLEVYTVLGQKVMTLVNENRSAGWHTVSFNGSGLSSGVYVYRIQAGGMVQTRKLMLVK
jgi:surface protein